VQRKHLEHVFNKPVSKVVNAVTMLKTLQNHVCPANALPSDIWCNIFYLTIIEVKVDSDDAPYHGWKYRLRTNHSHLATLVTVCRYWRDICVQTPSLWSRVSWHITRLGCFSNYRVHDAECCSGQVALSTASIRKDDSWTSPARICQRLP